MISTSMPSIAENQSSSWPRRGFVPAAANRLRSIGELRRSSVRRASTGAACSPLVLLLGPERRLLLRSSVGHRSTGSRAVERWGSLRCPDVRSRPTRTCARNPGSHSAVRWSGSVWLRRPDLAGAWAFGVDSHGFDAFHVCCACGSPYPRSQKGDSGRGCSRPEDWRATALPRVGQERD